MPIYERVCAHTHITLKRMQTRSLKWLAQGGDSGRLTVVDLPSVGECARALQLFAVPVSPKWPSKPTHLKVKHTPPLFP